MADEADEADAAGEDPITEEKLFWFFVTAYILHAIGSLAEGKAELLEGLDPFGWGNWKEHVKGKLQIDEGFINSVYALVSEYKNKVQAVGFILRGFGCPNVGQRLGEFPELLEN